MLRQFYFDVAAQCISQLQAYPSSFYKHDMISDNSVVKHKPITFKHNTTLPEMQHIQLLHQ